MSLSVTVADLGLDTCRVSLGRDSGLRVFYLPVVSQGQQPALWGLMLFRPGFLDGDASENLDRFECHPSYLGNTLSISLSQL